MEMLPEFHETSQDPLYFQKFAEFYLCAYLQSIQQAYGALIGFEGFARLRAESQSLKCDGQHMLTDMRYTTSHLLDLIKSSTAIEDEILKCVLVYHFSCASCNSISSAMLKDDSRECEPQICSEWMNLCVDILSLRCIRRLITIRPMNDGSVDIHFNISAQKKRWLWRFSRTLLLSLVLAKGKIKPAAVVFSMISVTWFLQRTILILTSQNKTQLSSHEEKKADHISEHEDAEEEEEEEESKENGDSNLECPLPAIEDINQLESTKYHFLRPVIEFILKCAVLIQVFLMSLNPNWALEQ